MNINKNSILKRINVTQPFLPPLEEFIPYLESIWKSKNLTNNGPFHKQLEDELCKFLGVKYISLFSNGTAALVTALQLKRITGEVITTPFSFVATAHSLHWNGIKPVFVDIETEYCNIDPAKIEAAITPKTTAILPVHVYGNPCNIDEIQQIADTYGLIVIYDACHAFGVEINGKSILNFGDLSVLSFHATKTFNTFEGGAIVCHDSKTKQRIDYLKNFGFAGETKVIAPGVNAKMNEFQAALGLLQLKYYHQIRKKRKAITVKYREGLKNVPGIRFMIDKDNVNHNYAYFPVFINNLEFLLSKEELYEQLKSYNVFTRRYFYPLISKFSPYRSLPSANVMNLINAEKLSNEVLCLPIYPDLEDEIQNKIINLIIEIGCQTQTGTKYLPT